MKSRPTSIGLLVYIFIFLVPICSHAGVCGNTLYRLASSVFSPEQNLQRLLATSLPATKEAALFEPGSHEAVLKHETELRAQGVSAIILRSPTPEDIAALTQARGYIYGPNWTTWHRATPAIEELSLNLAAATSGKPQEVDSDYRRKLKRSEGLSVSVESLTDQNYAEFFHLYEKTTIERNNGTRTVLANHTSTDGATRGNLQNWKAILARDPESQNLLVGGILVELFPDMQIGTLKGVAKIKTAGYLREVQNSKGTEYGKLQVSHRAQHELKVFAATHGFQVLSYGSDPNFYSAQTGSNLGLPAYKYVSGFTPFLADMYPGALGEAIKTTRIIKVLRPEDFAEAPDRSPKYFFFSFGKDGKLVPHFVGDFEADFPLRRMIP